MPKYHHTFIALVDAGLWGHCPLVPTHLQRRAAARAHRLPRRRADLGGPRGLQVGGAAALLPPAVPGLLRRRRHRDPRTRAVPRAHRRFELLGGNSIGLF